MSLVNPPPLKTIPQREPAPYVSDAVLDRLAKATSGSLTTQLDVKGFRQPVLHGLKPLTKRIKPFAGRACTDYAGRGYHLKSR